MKIAQPKVEGLEFETKTFQDITSKQTINILGVIFDATLKWSYQANQAITKANRSKFAIQMIGKNFSKKERKYLLTAYLYSVQT